MQRPSFCFLKWHWNSVTVNACVLDKSEKEKLGWKWGTVRLLWILLSTCNVTHAFWWLLLWKGTWGSPASRSLYSWLTFLPSSLVVPASACSFVSIGNNCATMQNLFLISPSFRPHGYPIPALSSPASRRTPAPITPGSPCPPPHCKLTLLIKCFQY